MIGACSRHAEETLDGGQAQDYADAAAWQKPARVAYQIADRMEAWQTSLEALIVRHQREYKLRPLLEGLRSWHS